MTPIAQHKGAFKMDASSTATAVTDYSTHVVGIVPKPKKNVGGHHTIGNDWEQQTEGGKSLELEIKVRVDKTTSSLYYILSDWMMVGTGARTCEIYTPDTSVGSLKISGEFYIVNPDKLADIQGGKGDAQIASFTLRGDSTIVLATA